MKQVLAATRPRFAAVPGTFDRVRDLIRRSGVPRLAWHSVVADVSTGAGPPQTAAFNAAFAYQVTGEPQYARGAFHRFTEAAAILSTTSEGLLAGDITGHLAFAYDFARQAWSRAERAYALRVFERASEFFVGYRWPNLDQDDKASNWVAVVRGGELAMQLAVAGEQGFTGRGERIALLLDEVRRHFEDGYGDSGWSQEGYDYLRYGIDTGGAAAVWAAQACGIGVLDEAFKRPRFADLVLQTQSVRPAGDRVQFGVGERTGRPSPAFLGTGSEDTQAAYVWLFQQAVRRFGRGTTDPLWTLLRWPDVVPRRPAPRAALLDGREGAYAFRDFVRNEDDTLIGVTNRNASHFGWQQHETFALSLIGQGTTWARMPAKEGERLELFSKPMVDGLPKLPGGADGEGRTLAARGYPGQGGGYLCLDGHRNYGIAVARRELAVDLQGRGSISAVLAVHDQFSDAVPHTFDWQLSPEPGVEISHGDHEYDARTFLFRRDDAWLKGWLLAPGDAHLTTADGAFRITRSGRSADFRLVLATGRGAPPNARAERHRLTLAGHTYDVDDLAGFTPGGRFRPSRRPVLELSTDELPFMPGATRSVTATLGWWQPRPLPEPAIALNAPDGWTAVEQCSDLLGCLREGESASVTWSVTAPSDAAPGDYPLRVTAPTDPAVVRTTTVRLVPTDLALGRPAEQSSTLGEAGRATNGNLDGRWGHGSVSHTLEEIQPWWQTDLGEQADISDIILWNRTDQNTDRLRDFYVLLSDTPFPRGALAELLSDPEIWRHHEPRTARRTTRIPVHRRGRHVRVQLAAPTASILALGEVQVIPPQPEECTS
ncbi:NEW3 domain-containing protein [Streptomyces sp. C10-9-1]|uniref:NEW3 domain-containing protein n=1 Tax=Streptomyces sp. C10-9-1 TaxID=1859285 RepID=UPI003D740964